MLDGEEAQRGEAAGSDDCSQGGAEELETGAQLRLGDVSRGLRRTLWDVAEEHGQLCAAARTPAPLSELRPDLLQTEGEARWNSGYDATLIIFCRICHSVHNVFI